MPPSKKHEDSPDDKLFNILANSTDLEQRRLYISGEVDEASAYRFIIGMHALDRTADAPITVILNSCGGLCHEGFAIYDAIKFAQNEVYVVVFGQAASMGSVILQAGDKRLIAPEADFMIHDVAIYDPPTMNLSQANSLSGDLKRLQGKINRILSERSGHPLRRIEEWCKEETTFNANAAVEQGFADKVLEYSKKKELVS